MPVATTLNLDALLLEAVNALLDLTLSKIDSSELVRSVEKIDYGQVTKSITPLLVDSITHINGTDVQETPVWNRTKKTSASFTWQSTQTVRTGASGTIKLSIPKIGDLSLGEITVGQTVETTFGENEAKGTSIEQTWSWTFPLPVPPHSRVAARVFVSQATVSAPFSGTMVLTGSIYPLLFFPGRIDNRLKPIPVGRCMRAKPHPDVVILDDNRIQCVVGGEFVGIEGTDIVSEAKQSNLDPASLIRFRAAE